MSEIQRIFKLVIYKKISSLEYELIFCLFYYFSFSLLEEKVNTVLRLFKYGQ